MDWGEDVETDRRKRRSEGNAVRGKKDVFRERFTSSPAAKLLPSKDNTAATY